MGAGNRKKNIEDLEPHLLRYGEIGTKSSNVRKHFEDILIDNIERTFLSRNKEVITEKRGLGRIFAYTQNENTYLFSRIFGIVSYSRVKKLNFDLKEVKKQARKFAEDISGTFAVRARRVGEHEYTSQDVEEEVGSVILDENPKLDVDLDDPEHEFHIEIRHSYAYIFTEIEEGPGGLPLSSQGKVLSYVENKYDFLATWMIMKRGARPYVFTDDKKWIERLKIWDPNLKAIEVKNFQEMMSMEHLERGRALVLGDRLEDHRKIENDMMVIRPLIGFIEERIEKGLETIKRLERKGSI